MTTTWKITVKDPESGAWIDTGTPLTTTETTRTFDFVTPTTYLVNPAYGDS
ncbi:hypothetical protein H8R18_00065 [Nanchangia anserum]|uniref:hypothetical protein n=1 Tax=Nanchangia anserum TaxID=2692125 RepID=UPI0018835F3E|nr:hypothetical protein [Nanchangia anserum]QOX81827.1 hypothetical protein H8R18_00065 [Nanchangia anserum]